MRSHQPFYQDIMGYNGLYTHIFDGGYDGGQREALQIGGLQHKNPGKIGVTHRVAIMNPKSTS